MKIMLKVIRTNKTRKRKLVPTKRSENNFWLTTNGALFFILSWLRMLSNLLFFVFIFKAHEDGKHKINGLARLQVRQCTLLQLFFGCQRFCVFWNVIRLFAPPANGWQGVSIAYLPVKYTYIVIYLASFYLDIRIDIWFWGDVTPDDSQRRFLVQHSVAKLPLCLEWLQLCSNIATLCFANSSCCKSFHVTLSLTWPLKNIPMSIYLIHKFSNGGIFKNHCSS